MERDPDDAAGRGHDEAVVELDRLTKRFSAEVLALDDVTFGVARGQVCGLLGPNGAGKTTSLRILLGLVRPTSGSTALFGERIVPGAAVLGRVGALIEEPAFVPYLSGWVNLRLYWEGGGGDWATARVEDALRIAGLGDAIGRKVKTYSHGMRQRLGIARALLGHPELLVLDEPTNGLDPQEMREIRHLLRSLAAADVTVLLSSHLLSEVEQVCSHAVVLDKGRLIHAGTVEELERRGARSAYLEVDDVARARRVLEDLDGVQAVTAAPPAGLTVKLDTCRRSELVAALVGAGVAVETVTSRHGLEDAFLELLAEESL